MKVFTLTLTLFLASFVSFAGKLVLIPVNNTNNLESLFNNNGLKIHYYCNDYVLATSSVASCDNAIILDENAFVDVSSYEIVFCDEQDKIEYLSNVSKKNQVLYAGDHFMIIKVLSNEFIPAKNDGTISVRNIEARLPKKPPTYPVITEPDEDVLEYISQVSEDRMTATIQTLQDYETRFCTHPNSVLAQNWIKEQYDALGLDVFIHEFSQNKKKKKKTLSHNVIAIQYGTEFSDEYVVCGGHYDSFNYDPDTPFPYVVFEDDAPGADDNAVGTTGILETARILSQYKFKRSIIYCAFAAEESGLNGSGFYAEQCAAESMNIVGYFNMDVGGYLKPGHVPPEEAYRIHLIHYNSSQPLADYYKNICDVYFPQITITDYDPPYAGSDYASFHNMGYMGIHPFEDFNGVTPYMHTSNDIIGLSFNSPDLAALFTKANLASVATLAMSDPAMPPPVAPPTNCVAEPFQTHRIKITWEAPAEDTPTKYNIYRDGTKIAQVGATQLQYVNQLSSNDYNVHCYKVTAQYGVFEGEFSNESCTSVVGISEYDSKIKISPNPANNELQVTSYELRITDVEVFDVFGKKISSHHLIPTSSHHLINILNLQPGIYFVRIFSDDKIIGNSKIVKQ
jgi:hypothetical protein